MNLGSVSYSMGGRIFSMVTGLYIGAGIGASSITSEKTPAKRLAVFGAAIMRVRRVGQMLGLGLCLLLATGAGAQMQAQDAKPSGRPAAKSQRPAPTKL